MEICAKCGRRINRMRKGRGGFRRHMKSKGVLCPGSWEYPHRQEEELRQRAQQKMHQAGITAAQNDWYRKPIRPLKGAKVSIFHTRIKADSLDEIKKDYLEHVENSPAWAQWYYPREVWLLSRTWWRIKFFFEWNVSIPFWIKTRSIRKRIGWHHYSDDAEGDC